MLCGCIGDDIDDQLTYNDDGTVNIALGSDKREFAPQEGTRSIVTTGGATDWTTGDQVLIIDNDVERTVRVFDYVSNSSSGNFAGRLQAGLGEQTYYAYHMPAGVSGTLLPDMTLAVAHSGNMDIVMNGVILGKVYGSYCPMVAEPAIFDAESRSSKKIEFNHINAMFESRIFSDEAGSLNDVTFNKVVFTLTADSIPAGSGTPATGWTNTPFNTEVVVNMAGIVGRPNLKIPYTETPDTRVNSAHTSITYNGTKTLNDLYSQESGLYSIPMFLLPTTAAFDSTATLEFFLNDNSVLTLKKHSKSTSKGLMPCGFNEVRFTDENIHRVGDED